MRSQLPRLRLVAQSGPDTSNPIDFADGQLVAAVRAGDPRAARALYERSRPVVARTINRLLRPSDHEYDDVCQQAMVEIVRSIDQFRGECPFTAWVGLVSARVAYKSLRRRQLERRTLAEVARMQSISKDHPARQALQRSLIERIKRHLQRVHRDRAWAFLLHDVHGYDLREMAQIMGTSVAAAQSRLVRGRRELHDYLAADPELAGELARRAGRT